MRQKLFNKLYILEILLFSLLFFGCDRVEQYDFKPSFQAPWEQFKARGIKFENSNIILQITGPVLTNTLQEGRLKGQNKIAKDKKQKEPLKIVVYVGSKNSNLKLNLKEIILTSNELGKRLSPKIVEITEGAEAELSTMPVVGQQFKLFHLCYPINEWELKTFELHFPKKFLSTSLPTVTFKKEKGSYFAFW